jgi:hypothetical protein
MTATPHMRCVVYHKTDVFILRLRVSKGINHRGHVSSIVTTKTEQNNGIPMFNTSNEGTGGFGISYSSRKMCGKVLNFI